MKQSEDCFTLDMLPVAIKRARGRPRKDNALTDADRARRYRQRQALKRTMTAKMQGMNLGQIGKLRRAQPKGSLSFSVLCEMTLQRLVPVSWS